MLYVTSKNCRQNSLTNVTPGIVNISPGIVLTYRCNLACLLHSETPDVLT